MTIAPFSDHSQSRIALDGLSAFIAEPYKAALRSAMIEVSTVALLGDAMEALYGAVMKDQTLTGANLTSVATGCAKMAAPIVYWGFLGKADRASQILSAMNSVIGGTAPSALSNAPDLDQKFAPPIVNPMSAAPLAQSGAPNPASPSGS